jgi:hypothetical protein
MKGKDAQKPYCIRKKAILVIVLFSVAFITVSVVGLTVCSKYVWAPLHDLSSPRDVRQCEGNVPILAEYDSFFVKEFTVNQQVRGDLYDSFHTVFVFLSNTACSNLPIVVTTESYNETSELPYGPVYMLKNSIISLNVCASTKSPDDDPLILYILKTVEKFLNFDPKHPSKQYYRKHILVGNNGFTNCTNISLVLSQSDYYTINFLLPKGITLVYNITVNIKQIDVDAVNTTLLGTFKSSDGDQTIRDTVKLGTGKHCLFADIQTSSNATSQDYTTLELQAEPRVNAGVGITVTALLVCFVVVLLCEVLVYVSVRKLVCYYKQRGYKPVTIINED